MWNPDQYERFKQERRQPFDDLLALVEHRPRMRVADLGCGTGELTRVLHQHLDATETIGIDNSETMLMKSGTFGSDVLRFERGDIEAFIADRPFDLIFSNAALQWLPDHAKLLPRLTSFLAADGQIAIQVPANDDHPSHTVAAEVAQEFGIQPRHATVLPPEEYAALLNRLGFAQQNVRLQVYGHTLAESREVIEWVRGTLLTEYERQLSPADYEKFLGRYSERLLEKIGEQRPYFFAFKRVLMWGTF